MINAKVVYDNNIGKEEKGLIASWGFSVFIRSHGRSILFDTGADSKILINNINQLGLNVEDIHSIVISHTHGDHIGGLRGLLKTNPSPNVYIPGRYSALQSNSYNVIEGCQKIYEGIFIINYDNSQALIFTEDENMTIFVSRTPLRALKIIKKAYETMKKDINCAFCGFCLHSPLETEKAAKFLHDIGVKKIVICHCSDELDKKILDKKFECMKAGVGTIIKI